MALLRIIGTRASARSETRICVLVFVFVSVFVPVFEESLLHSSTDSVMRYQALRVMELDVSSTPRIPGQPVSLKSKPRKACTGGW